MDDTSGRLNGNGEVEGSAFAHPAFGPSATSMAGDDAAYVGESDAGAFELGRTMQPLEHAEEFVDVSHVEADTVVADEKDRFVLGPRVGIFAGRQTISDFDARLWILA